MRSENTMTVKELIEALEDFPKAAVDLRPESQFPTLTITITLDFWRIDIYGA